MGIWASQPAAMQSLEDGNSNMKNGAYERAIKHYQECLEVTNEISVKIMAFFGLGNAYTLSDEWQEG